MIFNLFQKVQTYETKVMSSHLLIKAKASEKILHQAADMAHDIEKKLSAYQDSSEISRINQHAGKTPVKCSPLTIDIIKIALEIAKATEGVFDPTIGALTQKGYGFGTTQEKLLSKTEQKRLKEQVNYKDLEVIDDTVFLKRKKMAIDLGGIGKGYAADKIIDFLKSKGVKQALVSVGGEIYTYGKMWNVGIQHPRENRLLVQVGTSAQATSITSSGDYERFIQSPSHHHILAPSNAKSVNLYSSVSLISNSLDAGRMDALNTAFFQMGKEQILTLAQAYDIGVFLVDKAMQTYQINQIEDRVERFVLV